MQKANIKDKNDFITGITYYDYHQDENKYYEIKDLSNYNSGYNYYYLTNNYILDTASKKTYVDREYYELIPLYQKYDNITKTKLSLNKVIREAVHTYANEPYHNIIIKDLDDYGLEQLTYKGDIPLYALLTKDEQFV
jgi:hypothetical protein